MHDCAKSKGHRDYAYVILIILVVTSLMFSGSVTPLLHRLSYGTKSSEQGVSRNSNAIPQKIPSGINKANSVNVNELYNQEPAPMGIADFGIGPGNTPYSYSTSSFMGIAKISSLTVYNSTSGSSSMTFQLNVNLEFYIGNTEYVYWIQDVAFIDTSNNNIQFIDNVWNMSSPNANMYTSTISGNGQVSTSGGTGYYYDIASNTLSGNNINLAYPATVRFMVNSTVSSGEPQVSFMYNDGSGWQTYDLVSFIFAPQMTSDYGFVVNGYQYDPTGYLFYDAELILGGPGGGSQTTDTGSSLALQLQYWNGHNYQMVPNAYNFGSNTAEGIDNTISAEQSNTVNGNLHAYVTQGSGSLSQLYNQNQIGFINLTSYLNGGTLDVNNTPHSFTGNDVNLTLAPGYYQLDLYDSSGSLIAAGSFTLKAGEYLPLYAISDIRFEETGLDTGKSWSVVFNSNTYSSSTDVINIGGNTGLSPGTYSYSINNVPGYTIQSSSSGSVSVTIYILNSIYYVYVNITFIPVLYRVTFAESGLAANLLWSVSISGSSISTSSSSMSMNEPNGTYSYTVSSPIKYGYGERYVATIAQGTFTVDGSPVTVSTTYVLQYQLIITLRPNVAGYTTPSGVNWYNNGTDVSIHANAYNGYIFSNWSGSGNQNYSGTKNSSTVQMNSYVNETANYIQIKYNITFRENGLALGTQWWIAINGYNTSSGSATITFKIPNGTYQYRVDTPVIETTGTRYVAVPTGYVSVNGVNKTVNISYTKQFYLNITSNNNIAGIIPYNLTGWQNASKIIKLYAIPNGTYIFESWNGTGTGSYTGTRSNVSITMNGAITETARFTKVYVVTFKESGLTDGSEWAITVNNIKNSSTETTIKFEEPNGTYTFNYSTVPGYTINTPYTFSVNGHNIYVNITFVIVNYTVLFIETGLPTNTNWTVILSGVIQSSTNNVIRFKEPNGTYSYTAIPVPGYSVNGTGNLTIKGALMRVDLSFTSDTYKIIFVETGLAPGTVWKITMNGNTESSSSDMINFTLGNGTYSYTVSNVSGYSTTLPISEVTVAGSNVRVQITYTAIENGTTNNGVNYLSSIFNGVDLLLIGTVILLLAVAIILFLRKKAKK